MARDRVEGEAVFVHVADYQIYEMASSSSQVAEPVLQDSLSYWEKQSATYNGVLGACDYPSHVSLLIQALICNRGRRLRQWRMPFFLYLSVCQADLRVLI